MWQTKWANPLMYLALCTLAYRLEGRADITLLFSFYAMHQTRIYSSNAVLLIRKANVFILFITTTTH